MIKTNEQFNLKSTVNTKSLPPSDGGVPASRGVNIIKGFVVKHGNELYAPTFFIDPLRKTPTGAYAVEILGQKMLKFSGAINTGDIVVEYSNKEPPFEPRKF